MFDRNGVLQRMDELSPVTLELGCGPRKEDPRAIGIDARDLPGVDIVGDALSVLRVVPDASVAQIRSSHFLEHVSELPELLGECARVLAAGGIFEATVPHFSNPYFYSDPTHRHFFGLYTLSYFIEDSPLARQVPNYEQPLPFRLKSLYLNFKSPNVFARRARVKRRIGKFVNRTMGRQEFYEENLCWILPCYELTISMVRH